MSTNCYVTKFIGSANNDNLEYFDAVMVHVKPLDPSSFFQRKIGQFIFSADHDLVFTIVKGTGTFRNNAKVYTQAANTDYCEVSTDADCDVLVTSKYNIGTVKYTDGSFTKIGKLTSMYNLDVLTLGFNSNVINIKDLQSEKPFKEVVFNGEGVEGDMGYMDLTELQKITIESNTKIIYNVIDFANANLTNLYCNHTGHETGCPLEDFVDAIGTNSGTITINYLSTGFAHGVTLGGQEIRNVTFPSGVSKSNCKIIWDASNIYLKDSTGNTTLASAAR